MGSTIVTISTVHSVGQHHGIVAAMDEREVYLGRCQVTHNELIGNKTSQRVISGHLIPALEFKSLVRVFVTELFWGGDRYRGVEFTET